MFLRSSSGHGTDLLYLFGPTMYKNFFKMDFQSVSERRFSKNLKKIIGDFAYLGRPNVDIWQLYNKEKKNFYNINGGYSSQNRPKSEFWTDYLPFLSSKLPENGQNFVEPPNCGLYQMLMWILLGLIVLLMVSFTLLLLLCIRRNSKATKLPEQSIFTMNPRTLNNRS